MSDPIALRCALEMVRRGFLVFPLKPGSKEPYTKQDQSPLAGGINVATTDPTRVRRWFAVDPSINYGVVASRHVVLDVDVVDRLQEIGPLPVTLTVLTPRGGLHLYFDGPGTGQRALLPGVDVRSTNGYVVGPGCSVNGKLYRVKTDAPVAALPERLRSRLAALAEAPPVTIETLVDLDPPGSWDAAVALLGATDGAIQGEHGDDATFRLCCHLRDLALSPESCLDVLLMHWNHKCVPEWPLEALRQKITNAFDYARLPAGTKAISVEFADVQPDAQEEPKERSSGFRPIDLSGGPAALPPRPWLIRDLALRGALTGLVAPPGGGKSTFCLAVALGMAIGSLDHLGLKLHEQRPHKVVLVNNEDDEDELRRRIYAACIYHKLDWDAVADRLVIWAPPNARPFKAIGRTKTRDLRPLVTYTDLHEALAGADLFILDPWVEMTDAEENDNGETGEVMQLFRETARRHNVGGILVHHTRKPPQATSDQYAGDPASARGASAWWGNVRILATLYAMSPTDAEKYGILESDRYRYTRLDLGKSSYTPRGEPTRWYETMSVTLEHGDGAPAIAVADLKTQMDTRPTEFHGIIAPVLGATGPMLAKDAAALIRQVSPFHAKTPPKELVTQVRDAFADGVTVDGVTVVLVGDQLDIGRAGSGEK